jgi:uncharacterized protein (TIGR02118 family)
MITVSVMYPNTEGSKFDMDYYLDKHIRLVHELMDDAGLSGTRVQKGVGKDAPYQVVAELQFPDMETMAKVMGEHGPKATADVPNFTDVTPVVQIAETIA